MLRPSARRPGQSGLFALIAIPVLLGVLLLLVFLFRTRDSLIELRNGGVAAALAGTDELVDDARLTADPDRLRPVFARARRSAADVARRNFVDGCPLELCVEDDDDNKKKGRGKPDRDDRDRDRKRDCGEVVLGHLDKALGGHFEPFRPDSPKPAWGRVNAVEMTVRQPGKPGVFTKVVGVLDDAVVGFRPWDDKPAPVMPVALFDGRNDGRDDDLPTWRQAVKRADDDWAFDRERGRFVKGHDGIPEVRVRVGRLKDKHAPEACGLPLVIGGGQPRRALEQVMIGLTERCLAADDGEFRLGDDLTRPQPANPDLFADDDGGPAEAAFRSAIGKPRVWPVFGGIDDHGRATLTGFTGARVVSVEREKGGGLLLVLQPAVVASPTAITFTEPSDRREKHGKDDKDDKDDKHDKHDRPTGDRTVVKVRLAG